MLLCDYKDYREILQRALDTWGYETQLSMAIGECGEFLTEVGRKAQGRSSNEKFIDEIADVIILMNQLGVYLGEEDLFYRIDYKMNKLKDKLDKNARERL